MTAETPKRRVVMPWMVQRKSKPPKERDEDQIISATNERAAESVVDEAEQIAALEEAKAEAEKIISQAKREADKLKKAAEASVSEEARAEAEKITSQAKLEAEELKKAAEATATEEARAEAEKIISQAKLEAEELKKAAEATATEEARAEAEKITSQAKLEAEELKKAAETAAKEAAIEEKVEPPAEPEAAVAEDKIEPPAEPEEAVAEDKIEPAAAETATATKNESAESPPSEKGTTQVKTSGDQTLYTGEIELIIASPVDPKVMTKLFTYLQTTPEVKLVHSTGSLDRGTTITVALDKPVPVISALSSRLPEVEPIVEQSDKDSPAKGKKGMLRIRLAPKEG